jgi:small-conductance mechanosensitive channel
MSEFNWEFVAIGAAKTALILVIVWVVNRAAKRGIPKLVEARLPQVKDETPEERANRAETLSTVFVGALKYAVWIVAFIAVLSAFGVDVWGAIAAIGVAGIAIGFAAEKIVRDYLVGFFILTEDWYRIEEEVIIGDIRGVVEEVGLRHTVLRDRDASLVYIPNHNVELATNATRDAARMRLDICVAYKENLSGVFDVINDVGQKLKKDPEWEAQLLSTPKAQRVNSLGESGVEIRIVGDTTPAGQLAVMGEMRRRLKDRFDEEGIEIPWPHTKVYFGNTLKEPVGAR